MAFAGTLARQGVRVIAMSRFGYLRTPMPADASAAAQADAHVCLLDALGIGRAAVMGGMAGAPSPVESVNVPTLVASARDDGYGNDDSRAILELPHGASGLQSSSAYQPPYRRRPS